jgi:hypothetical protein
MSPSVRKPELAPKKRRYLVHLLCAQDEPKGVCRYIVRFQLWAAHSSAHAQIHERAFTDECELIETINPLLPPGSDVRDVLSHIENPEGFLYLLHLSSEQAGHLAGARIELS